MSLDKKFVLFEEHDEDDLCDNHYKPIMIGTLAEINAHIEEKEDVCTVFTTNNTFEIGGQYVYTVRTMALDDTISETQLINNMYYVWFRSPDTCEHPVPFSSLQAAKKYLVDTWKYNTVSACDRDLRGYYMMFGIRDNKLTVYDGCQQRMH